VTAIVTLIAGLAGTEIALRAIGYRYSPLSLLPTRTAGDFRGAHQVGTVFTVFDPELFWRLDRAGVSWLNAQGFRGSLAPVERDPSVTLVFAMGDSNTAGPLKESYHWPQDLEDLAALNVPRGRQVRVVNAGVFGYTSFQGLRRFRQVVRYHPDVVFFGFGSNDAQVVRLSDADYATRLNGLGWLGSLRLGPPLAQALWSRFGPDAVEVMTQRVPLEDYRQNLESFVAEARASKIVPVLLTRPYHGASGDPEQWITHIDRYNAVVREVAQARRVELVDVQQAFAQKGDLFVDESHLGRTGYREMAQLMLPTLAAHGVVKGDLHFASSIEPGRLDDARAELRSGLWARELWDGQHPGRWTAREAEVVVERRGSEGGLEIEGRFYNPAGESSLRVAVNGVPVGVLRGQDGPFRRTLDLRSAGGREIVVRLVSEHAFVGVGDTRTLGVFLQRLALVASPYSGEVRLADLPSGAPELGDGWWEPEDWSFGGRGRWTKGAATLHLGRHADESRVMLELSGNNPEGYVALHVEADGRLLRVLRVDNSRASYSVDLDPGGASDVEIRLAPEKVFVPRRVFGTSDVRQLGVFVHSARLAGDSAS